MSAARLVLHVGESNAGMGTVQESLWANRQELGDRGVVLPRRRRDVAAAARSLVRWTPGGTPPDAWQELVANRESAGASAVVVSHEGLARLDEKQVAGLAQTAGDLTVVITVADLERLLVAEWLSSLGRGRSWTLTEYATAVAGGDEQEEAASHFWRRHDHDALVSRWAAVASVTVVTVPPTTAPVDLLWSRFCQAADLPGGLPAASHSAELGLDRASAEVLRRLNQTDAVAGLSRDEYAHDVGARLARRVLAQPSGRAPVAVPPEVSEWASTRSAAVVDALIGTGVEVVGSVDDLLMQPTTQGADAGPMPDDELLDAALDALAGYAAEHARHRAEARDEGSR